MPQVTRFTLMQKNFDIVITFHSKWVFFFYLTVMSTMIRILLLSEVAMETTMATIDWHAEMESIYYIQLNLRVLTLKHNMRNVCNHNGECIINQNAQIHSKYFGAYNTHCNCTTKITCSCTFGLEMCVMLQCKRNGSINDVKMTK